MLTVSILVASGGAFLFTLILAKFWPAAEYGDFVSGFSIVSYLSFPILYGVIPQVLRESTTNGRKTFFSITTQYGQFLLAYAFFAGVVLLFVSPSLVYLSTVTSLLLMILAIGIVEALIRDMGVVNLVFYARAFGIFLSICFLLIVLTFSWERLALTSFFARVIPSAMVLVFLYFIALKQTSKSLNGIISDEIIGVRKIFGVLDATFISLIVGGFQYAFIVVGKRIIDPDKYVIISMGIMVSMTVCQKLIEPYIFKLYVLNGELKKNICGRNISGKWIWLSLKLLTFSYVAQIIVNIFLFRKYAFFDAAFFSLGSTIVSMAYFIHSVIYLRGNAIKLSAVLLIAMFGAFLVLFYSHRADMLPYCFLAMAALYLFFVVRRISHS